MKTITPKERNELQEKGLIRGASLYEIENNPQKIVWCYNRPFIKIKAEEATMKRKGEVLYLRTQAEINSAMEQYKDWKLTKCYRMLNRTRNETIYVVVLEK